MELTGWPCLNTGHVVLWCHKSGKTQAQKHLERPPKVVSCLIETSKWYISTIYSMLNKYLYPNWERFFECIWCLQRFHNYNLKRKHCTIYHLKWFLLYKFKNTKPIYKLVDQTWSNSHFKNPDSWSHPWVLKPRPGRRVLHARSQRARRSQGKRPQAA